jgi:hypothetical protein
MIRLFRWLDESNQEAWLTHSLRQVARGNKKSTWELRQELDGVWPILYASTRTAETKVLGSYKVCAMTWQVSFDQARLGQNPSSLHTFYR